MSTYGTVAFQYKAEILWTLHCSTNELDSSMLSSSVQSKSTNSPETFSATEVELGTDPLTDSHNQIDSLLSDYSFCNVDLKDCSSPKPGTSSPIGDTSGYYIPSDYPRHLGLDTELKLTGSKEPYVMAEFSRKDELQFMGSLNKDHPKGSLDLTALETATPGARMENSLLNNIPKIYPELSISSDTSDSYKSLDDSTTFPKSSSSSSTSLKPRANPFSADRLPSKRNVSNVAYSDVAYTDVVPVNDSSSYQSAHQTQMLDSFVGSVASSSGYNENPPKRYENPPKRYESPPKRYESPPKRYENPPNKYHNIPSYHPKLKAVKSLGQTSEIDEVVTALRGTLNNAVQYIASLPGNNFETASSICFLGKLYMGKHYNDDRELESGSVEERHGTFHEFLLDFQSRVWLTYRRGFASLQGTNLTSDTGWGCMLRTGQMMLATALQINCFGREWRRNNPGNVHKFKEFVRLFGESFDHPFSLQHLLKIGKEHLNKSYGEWYGPSTVAYVLRVCVDYAKKKGSISNLVNIRDFVIFTATDCMVFKGDIIKTATTNGTRSWSKTLVLISVRMGADELNLSYREPIRTFLLSPLCIGIMGGRKRHSLYFTGFQGNKLIHYDPHTCQPTLKMSQDFNAETYICAKPRKMSFSKMDPSCTFGFFLKTEADLFELTKLTESMGKHKIFEILDGTKEDYLALVHDPSVKAFDHNESMFDDGADFSADIGSLEGSDFEYLE